MNSFALALLLLVQDSESAAASKVSEAPLPAGAVRALDKDGVEQMTTILKAMVKDVPLSGIEVLMWAGDYMGDKGAALRKEAGKLLEKAGYECKQAASEQKVEEREIFLCSAIRPNRRIYGVWIASKDAAVLTWGLSDAPAAGGAETAFGNVIYAVPKGWKAEVAADSVTLTPNDLLPEEKLFLLILPGKEFKGDLQESAQELWTETCAAFNVDGGKLNRAADVTTSLKGWKYFRHYTEVRKDESRLYLNATFIQVGDRLERVAVLTNWVSMPYRETPFDSPKYTDAINTFIFGLRFKNHAEPKRVEASLKGEGIVGVWVGLSMQFVNATGRLEYNGTTAAFYSNGQVFYNSKLQTFLFDGVDPMIAREITPRWWGTWTFGQGTGTMKMPYGDIAMELKGETLVLTTSKTPHKFVRLDSVDGTRLEGTYAFSEHNGKVPKITFSADGRFTDDGALNVLEHCLYRLYHTTRKPGQGTYEVRNYTIVFTYDDGRRFTSAFLGLTYKRGDRTPAALTLGFNDDTLKRQ
jgi:hypothetical protein